MHIETYYRLSLPLPFVLPGLASLALYLSRPAEKEGIEMLATLWVVLVGSLNYGGIPYAILALALLAWSRGKGERPIAGALCLAPLLMLPIQWLYFLILSAASLVRGGMPTINGQSPDNQFASDVFWGLYYSIWTLGLGYSYVALMLAGAAILNRLSWLHREIADAT